MIGRLFSLAAAVSLALCAAAVAASLRSRSSLDHAELLWRGDVWAVWSHGGRVCLSNEPQLKLDRTERAMRSREWHVQVDRTVRSMRDPGMGSEQHQDALRRLGRLQEQGYPDGPRGRPWVDRTIPYSLMILPTALPPLLWFAARVRGWARGRRGARRGLCRRCGYDLRATPGRCPECGTITGV